MRQKEDRKNRVRKRRVVRRIYGMKYSWKGHKDRNTYKNRMKRSGQARLVYVTDINRNIPTTWRWASHGGKRDVAVADSALFIKLDRSHVWRHVTCVCFCLYGPFNYISFHKFSWQLSAFSLCSSGLISALLVLSTIYLIMKVSLSPDIILCG